MTIGAGGTEILVSTTNAGTQANQQITTLADGGFALAWVSGSEVRGRVFAADGTPVNDSDFLFSPSVPYNFTPQITALGDGGFAVTDLTLGRVFAADGTLVSEFPAHSITALANGGFAVLGDGALGALSGRVYAADGTPVNGSDFLISTYADVSNTQITALAKGGFAVTYGNGARVFAADGTLVNGSDFLDTGNQVVTALADGGFAVTDGIRALVFAADGTLVNDSDFPVSTTNAIKPDITALADGGFAVTWVSLNNGVSLDNGGCIRALVFAADGTPVNDSDFPVSTANPLNINFSRIDGPQITALADGGFAVTWKSWSGTTGLYGSDFYDIRARVFAADGTPVNGSDFLVSTTQFSIQMDRSFGDPQITALADGGFAVAWQAWGDNFDIHARVFSVNEVPAVTAPGGLTTDEDTALVINGFSVDDPDGSQLTVTLTAASTLTLSQIDGLAFTDGDGTADQKMTFSGAIADINAALAGMTYAPTSDFNALTGTELRPALCHALICQFDAIQGISPG